MRYLLIAVLLFIIAASPAIMALENVPGYKNVTITTRTLESVYTAEEIIKYVESPTGILIVLKNKMVEFPSYQIQSIVYSNSMGLYKRSVDKLFYL